MTPFVIIVDFLLKPGARPAFRELIDANARASATREPGCRRFDVVEPTSVAVEPRSELVKPGSEADRILLYEIYDDVAAFEAHLKTAHYAEFSAASAPLIAGKTVFRCDLVCDGSAVTAK